MDEKSIGSSELKPFIEIVVPGCPIGERPMNEVHLLNQSRDMMTLNFNLKTKQKLTIDLPPLDLSLSTLHRRKMCHKHVSDFQ